MFIRHFTTCRHRVGLNATVRSYVMHVRWCVMLYDRPVASYLQASCPRAFPTPFCPRHSSGSSPSPPRVLLEVLFLWTSAEKEQDRGEMFYPMGLMSAALGSSLTPSDLPHKINFIFFTAAPTICFRSRVSARTQSSRYLMLSEFVACQRVHFVPFRTFPDCNSYLE